MKGFIVASVDKKALKKLTTIRSDVIKYTPVISIDSMVEKAFVDEFPEHHILFAMPIEEIKSHIAVIEKLLV